MIEPVVGSLLVAGGLAAPMVGMLGLALRRSVRRQECAGLRDQLVDAARTGELDIADWRVFSLIDWFDQVAATGRVSVSGRHGPVRRDLNESLAHSLAASLVPLGPPGRADAFWAEPPPAGTGVRLQAVAVRYREQRQQRLRHVPRRGSAPRLRVAVTGASKPLGALIPVAEVMTGWDWSTRPNPGSGRSPASAPDQVVLPSLAEEIFAVASGAP